MRELRDVVRAWTELERAGLEAVLATVVDARGSTYRKPGARMLVTEDAWLAGAISGGCVERDLLRKAWWRTARARAVVLTYEGRREAEELEEGSPRVGHGLGCDGSIDVLVERVSASTPCHPLRLLARCVHERARGVVSTVVRSRSPNARIGDRLVLLDDEAAETTLAPSLACAVEACARGALANGASTRSRHADVDADVEVFHDVVLPPKPLVVFGSNHDALPLVRLASGLGWDVTLVERRPVAATDARFSLADRIVVGRAPDVLDRVALDARTSVVVMTHDYAEDRAILGALSSRTLGYVGVLGPRARTTRMIDELAAGGVAIDEAWRARVHAPIGLDLGGRAPEEIALSIVAEVQAVANGRLARAIREDAPRIARASSERSETVAIASP
jgi:xanthine/CO dehydrogenase XdhC/CoxF family maturation factor